MVDDSGQQLAHIEYPGLPADEVIDSVHQFYDEYYFRPKAAFRIVKKAIFNSAERKRLYVEAKAFLKTRSNRKKWAKEQRDRQSIEPPAPPRMPAEEETPTVEPVNA